MKNKLQRSNIKRKKLWQVHDAYHCSIIGSCLSKSDLWSFAKRCNLPNNNNSDAYSIHNRLIREASSRTKLARIIHKFLDKKHFLAIKRYQVLTDSESIYKQWNIDVKEGDSGGAYWAIMTHPEVKDELRNKYYGECHILSFETFSHSKKENQVMSLLKREVRTLQMSLKKERQKAYGLMAEITNNRERNAGLKYGMESMETEMKRALTNTPVVVVDEEIEKLNRILTKYKQENNQHERQVRSLKDNNMALKEQAIFSLIEQEELQKKNSLLQQKEKMYKEEITSLEDILAQNFGIKIGCSECKDYMTPECKGFDLCGQRVLYVGGQQKMVSHYKKLIETQGGVFLYHDGGREHSKQNLPKVLSSADAVLCPVDCVSHDACIRVKKICKQYSKPFVMMRSAGLSSLAKGLGDINNQDNHRIM